MHIMGAICVHKHNDLQLWKKQKGHEPVEMPQSSHLSRSTSTSNRDLYSESLAILAI